MSDNSLVINKCVTSVIRNQNTQPTQQTLSAQQQLQPSEQCLAVHDPEATNKKLRNSADTCLIRNEQRFTLYTTKSNQELGDDYQLSKVQK